MLPFFIQLFPAQVIIAPTIPPNPIAVIAAVKEPSNSYCFLGSCDSGSVGLVPISVIKVGSYFDRKKAKL